MISRSSLASGDGHGLTGRSLAAAVSLALAAPAGASHDERGQPWLQFHHDQQQEDLTFNQLLGINSWRIAGYFGSGMTGHPNKGYTLTRRTTSSDYSNENFPGSAQTQVTGLNDVGNTVGFWVDGDGRQLRLLHLTNGNFHQVKTSRRAQRHAADRPAARHQRPRRRRRLLHQQGRQQPRLRSTTSTPRSSTACSSRVDRASPSAEPDRDGRSTTTAPLPAST